jgi:hypothetical protein
MAITIDSRPHVIGDLVIVTGTFANGDTIAIDLSAHLSRIMLFVCNETDSTARALVSSVDGTTAYAVEAGAGGGTWFALGQR